MSCWAGDASLLAGAGKAFAWIAAKRDAAKGAEVKLDSRGTGSNASRARFNCQRTEMILS